MKHIFEIEKYKLKRHFVMRTYLGKVLNPYTENNIIRFTVPLTFK